MSSEQEAPTVLETTRPKRIRRFGSKKLRTWKNSKGEWCVGNDCIKLEATEAGTRIKFNPDAKKCPPDMRKVAEAMLKTAEEGKTVAFQRLPEKW